MGGDKDRWGYSSVSDKERARLKAKARAEWLASIRKGPPGRRTRY